MKIERLDKKDFKKFKKTRIEFSNNVFCKEIYFYLLDYVKWTLKYRFKGLYLYGFTAIRISDKLKIAFFEELNKISNSEEKERLTKYYDFLNHIAEVLNKYIVRVDEPAYKDVMINYNLMIEILQDAPFFHDAYPINCKKIGNNFYIKFCLYASWISRENCRIYRLNSSYKGDDNTILITIKFKNVKLIKGLLEEKYVLNRSNNFLWDLDYEVIDKDIVRFDLFTIKDHEMIFTCNNIEFIESDIAEKVFKEVDNLILFEMLKFGPENSIAIENRQVLQHLAKDEILQKVPLLEQLQHDIFDYIYNDYNSINKTFKTSEEEIRQKINKKYSWLNETNVKKLIYQGKYYACHG